MDEYGAAGSMALQTIHKSKGLEYHTVVFIGHCQLEQSEGDFRRFASAIHQVACDV